jgi:hypothetical protein
MTLFQLWTRHNAVGITNGNVLDEQGVGVVVLGGQEFLFLHAQTGSGAHPASYPMNTGGKSDGA